MPHICAVEHITAVLCNTSWFVWVTKKLYGYKWTWETI